MTDSRQLLADYVRNHSEAAFRDLVARYLDLVYSTAVRLVDGDAHRAKDVAQIVFADLAKMARGFAPEVMLGGWLHRHTCFVAANTLRGERRRLLRERQAVDMNLLTDNSGADFSRLTPLLDEAINELEDADRTAILLRFFEQKDFRSVGHSLDSSEDAARMRVNRALDKLRELLERRGVTTSAAALSVVLTASAVQSAPVGLVAAISAAALGGAAVSTSTIIAATTKTIAMTALQKTLVAATVTVLAGAGIYEARQTAKLREQVQTLQQQQAPLAAQIQQLQRERDDATNRLADFLAENPRPNTDPRQTELLKLRGQVSALRADVTKRAESDSSLANMVKSPQIQEFMKTAMASTVDKVYAKLFADLHLTPEQTSALKQLLIAKNTAGMDSGAEMLSDKMTAAQLKQLGEQIAAEKAGVDNQIKDLLGTDGFAAYQAYDKNYLDRTTVSGPAGFEDQLAGGLELTADQREQLVQAMADARQNFKFTADYSNKSKLATGMAAMYSDENINRYQQEQEKLDELCAARAQTILSPEQLAAFQKFLSNRLAMGAMSLKMGAKVLGAPGGN